jgi:mono/diheme cytochrome c family protein
LLAGCRGQTSEESPVAILRNMYQQPRYNPQARSTYFKDGRTMRPPVEGSVAREVETNPITGEGRTVDGTGFVDTIPPAVVQRVGDMNRLVNRGQDRYGIYCVPCHGGLGDGAGMVPTVSLVPAIRPPTFHDDRLRHVPDGQIYATIRNGIRNMPSYRGQIPVADRWAIVAYVRALQLSQADQRTAALETAQ